MKKLDYMVRKRAYEKWAVNHNKRYTSEFNKVTPKLLKKDTILCFGKVTRNYLFVFPRMKTLGQDIYYECEPLSKMGGGTFQEITPASMQNVTYMAWILLMKEKMPTWHSYGQVGMSFQMLIECQSEKPRKISCKCNFTKTES